MKDATPLRATATRREFCTHACHAAAAVAVGSVLQGCGGGGGGGNPAGPGGGGIPSATPLTVINGSVTGGGVTVPVDGGSPLANVGGAALVRSPSADVLVYRSAQDAFQAVTATCTHEACTITGIRQQTYVCPCHGSQFTTTGAVVSGPATRSLRAHNTSLSGATLTIAL